jgi:hypothetical protein
MKNALQATGKEVWRLIHEEHTSMKKVASTLRISTSRAYELLAQERSQRDIAFSRWAANVPQHRQRGKPWSPFRCGTRRWGLARLLPLLTEFHCL